MSSNKTIIKFLCILAIVSLVLSYIVQLNIELGFCLPDSPWISNGFVFTVLTGVFASVVVALLLEIRQYQLNKAAAEVRIFYDSTILYAQLAVIKYNLLRIREHPEDMVSPESISMPVSICRQIKESLKSVDYSPIIKRRELRRYMLEYAEMVSARMDSFLFNASFIEQAIIKDKIEALKQTGLAGNPTYESYYTNLTVDKLLDDVVPIVDDFGLCMQKIARAVNKTEKWNQIYKDFTQFEEGYESPSLEKYLGL